MFESIQKTNTTRRRSRRWLSIRQIEDVRECMKDRLQEEYPEDYSVKDKQKMSKNIQKMNITEDVSADINDEDVRQMFQNFL